MRMYDDTSLAFSCCGKGESSSMFSVLWYRLHVCENDRGGNARWYKVFW